MFSSYWTEGDGRIRRDSRGQIWRCSSNYRYGGQQPVTAWLWSRTIPSSVSWPILCLGPSCRSDFFRTGIACGYPAHRTTRIGAFGQCNEVHDRIISTTMHVVWNRRKNHAFSFAPQRQTVDVGTGNNRLSVSLIYCSTNSTIVTMYRGLELQHYSNEANWAQDGHILMRPFSHFNFFVRSLLQLCSYLIQQLPSQYKIY